MELIHVLRPRREREAAWRPKVEAALPLGQRLGGIVIPIGGWVIRRKGKLGRGIHGPKQQYPTKEVQASILVAAALLHTLLLYACRIAFMHGSPLLAVSGQVSGTHRYDGVGSGSPRGFISLISRVAVKCSCAVGWSCTCGSSNGPSGEGRNRLPWESYIEIVPFLAVARRDGRSAGELRRNVGRGKLGMLTSSRGE